MDRWLGFTWSARKIPNVDIDVDLSKQGGKLLPHEYGFLEAKVKQMYKGTWWISTIVSSLRVAGRSYTRGSPPTIAVTTKHEA